MKKICLLICLLLMMNVPCALAKEPIPVAVMDFALPQGISSTELAVDGSYTGVGDFIIKELLTDKRFNLVDKALYSVQLADENVKTVGIIDQESAKKIGKIMNVRYIIYGNVTELGNDTNENGISGVGLDLHNVKAKVTLRMLDVQTGNILLAVSGEGKSESSNVKVGVNDDYGLQIGTSRVSSISAYNAIQKAAVNVVGKFRKKYFDVEGI
ncbi:CsgG/HfaB family protein [Anaerovibrio slackiae]|uniref:CsgG/HfaB family protein n=1 Tax=Anaerovibrio slackiae TaxID=2652309 RepID=UPI0038656946